jgi:hypothetical protein
MKGEMTAVETAKALGVGRLYVAVFAAFSSGTMPAAGAFIDMTTASRISTLSQHSHEHYWRKP